MSLRTSSFGLALLCAVPQVAAAAQLPHMEEGGESERRLHLKLDAAFTYGIGGQSVLGAQVNFIGYAGLWNTRLATGSFDVGLQAAYGNEPPWLAPWLQGIDVSGANHRIQALVTLGHTFHMGARRRAALGFEVFGGWNHWISDFTLNYPKEGVSGRATLSRDHAILGGQLRFAYRFSRHVGFNLLAGGPFPIHSSYVVGMFSVGVGLSFYLR
jgi:hypothetical protein